MPHRFAEEGIECEKSFLLVVGFLSLVLVETRHHYTMFDHHLRAGGMRGPRMGRGGMIGY